MTFTLQNKTESVHFDTKQIDANDKNFGFVWITKCPHTGWFGNTMAQMYQVQDARRIYAELLKAGYVKA